MTPKVFQNHKINFLIFLACFSLGLFIQGAIPFLAMTTLGQAVSVLGYPISFLQDGFLTIHTNSIGYPSKSAMSTMLLPALIMEPFIALGLHPANAFTFSYILFYTAGYVGLYNISKLFCVNSPTSSLLALLWFTLPIVFTSSNYSHLHFGLSFLPFSFFIIVKIQKALNDDNKVSINILGLYLFIPTIIIFTDGYTFILFAVGSSALILSSLIIKKLKINRPSLYFYLIHFFSFLFAYILYVIYTGKTNYSPAPINFFRSWGADLSFFLIPSYGQHYLVDTIGFSILRTSELYFGDASIWRATFILPILVIGIFCYIKSEEGTYKYGFLFILLFSLYMSFGPSLKINATKVTQNASASIPNNYELLPTGNAIISEKIPGFSNMRASYRWVALSFLSLWFFIVLYLSTNNNEKKYFHNSLILFLLLIYLPNLITNFEKKKLNYTQIQSIDNELLKPLNNDLFEGEIIAFIPAGNDFLINYISPALSIKTYNIGGDKNLEASSQHWPALMQSLKKSNIEANPNSHAAILLLLLTGNTDAVIFPFFDLLWGAHSWPSSTTLSDELNLTFNKVKDHPTIATKIRDNYAIFRLKNDVTKPEKEYYIKLLISQFCIPGYCIHIKNFSNYPFTQVGLPSDNKISSSLQQGFLLFGPYQSINAGSYRVTISGDATQWTGWSDITSSKGAYTHYKFEGKGNKKGVLIDEVINFEKDFNDIEIRIFVNDDDIISIAEIKLESLSND